jgi:4-amino-4-deoxy-L-arabinose transferase-like glycosyltransferase
VDRPRIAYTVALAATFHPSAELSHASGARPTLPTPWLAFAVALGLRAAFILLFRVYRIPNFDNHFTFAWEMGRIARALASGHGYSDPFRGPTGPTAWVAPLYPLVIAAVFRVCGIYSNSAALVLMLLNSLCSALTLFPLRAIAGRCFGRRLAIAATWTWAIYPFAMQYGARIWTTSLTALLFTCALALTLRMRGIGDAAANPGVAATPRRWLLLGLLWGLIALSDPSPLLVLPACFLWIVCGTGRAQLRAQLLRATLAGLVCCACIAPWTLRNWRVFHHFLPMRSNFGAELYLGNGPGANGDLMEYDHPNFSPVQYRLYRSLGEVAYCRMRGAAATAYIRRHPAHFALDTLRRFYYFWFTGPTPDTPNWVALYAPNANFIFTSLCGLLGLALALRKRVPAAGLFGWAVLLIPLVYYFVTAQDRFRRPLDPLLYLLTLYLWSSAEESNRVRWFSGKHPRFRQRYRIHETCSSVVSRKFIGEFDQGERLRNSSQGLKPI